MPDGKPPRRRPGDRRWLVWLLVVAGLVAAVWFVRSGRRGGGARPPSAAIGADSAAGRADSVRVPPGGRATAPDPARPQPRP